MEKLLIRTSEVTTWKNNNYRDYASETVNGKRLLFRINMEGNYIVSHGEEILYSGRSVIWATRAFNLCEKP